MFQYCVCCFFKDSELIWHRITSLDHALAFDLYVCKNKGLHSLIFLIRQYCGILTSSSSQYFLGAKWKENCFDWKRVYFINRRSRWAKKAGEKAKFAWIFKETEVVGRSSVLRKTFRIWFSDATFITSW